MVAEFWITQLTQIEVFVKISIVRFTFLGGAVHEFRNDVTERGRRGIYVFLGATLK